MSAMHAGVMTTSTEMMYAQHVTLTSPKSDVNFSTLHKSASFTLNEPQPVQEIITSVLKSYFVYKPGRGYDAMLIRTYNTG